jgi:hypothetical protein
VLVVRNRKDQNGRPGLNAASYNLKPAHSGTVES